MALPLHFYPVCLSFCSLLASAHFDNPDLFCLTETWIKPTTTAAELLNCIPPHYSLISTPRNGSNEISLALAVSCTHWSPSDHFPVFTRLSINPAPLSYPTLHSFRRLHSIDIGSFLTDLKSSQLISDPPKSLGPLLSAYNTTLSSLLDKHAPIVNKLSRRQSPSNP